MELGLPEFLLKTAWKHIGPLNDLRWNAVLTLKYCICKLGIILMERLIHPLPFLKNFLFTFIVLPPAALTSSQPELSELYSWEWTQAELSGFLFSCSVTGIKKGLDLGSAFYSFQLSIGLRQVTTEGGVKISQKCQSPSKIRNLTADQAKQNLFGKEENGIGMCQIQLGKSAALWGFWNPDK